MAFPTGWGRKHSITVDNTKVVGAVSLTSFPVLITLDMLDTEVVDAGANGAMSGGGDIRFSSDSAGVTQLSCEVVSFITHATPASRACEIWVKVPTVSYNIDTVIYVWYNNAGQSQPLVTAPYGRNAVWDNCAAVYHLNSLTDSSGNGFDLTPSGAPTLSTDAPFSGGSSYSFSGGSDWLENTAWSKVPYPFTVLSWIKASNTGTTALWTQGTFAANNWDSILWRGTSKPEQNNTGAIVTQSPTSLTTAQWYNIAAVFQTDDNELYIDGVSTDTNLVQTQNAGVMTDMTIGALIRPSSKLPFVGFIAEVRIVTIRQTTDWIATEYNNQSSPSLFASAGTPEAIGGGSSLTTDAALHGLTSGSVGLTQIHSLTLTSTSHDLSNDNVVLSLGQSLGILDGAHQQNTDTITLTQFQSIAIMPSDHVIGGTVPSLSILGGLATDLAVHSITSDTITIEQFQSLVAQNATHVLSSDQGTLYGPTSFTPHPDRTQQPQKAGRTTIPINNRTLRI